MVDYFTDVQRRLEQLCSALPDAVQKVFVSDLRDAFAVQAGLNTIPHAPYVDPVITGCVRQDLRFPGYEERSGPGFAFMIRPLTEQGASSQGWYGAPMWLGDVHPLEESALLERKISLFRCDSSISPETDKLIGIIKRQHPSGISKANQDLVVTMTIGDLLRAYEAEDGASFSGIQVQEVKAMIPTNPAYRTEAVGLVSNRGGRSTDHMCFGYGIGETFYRGRPVVSNFSAGELRLKDVDVSGAVAYFNVDALSQVQEGVADVKTGNMVVIALPLVGKDQIRSIQLLGSRYDSFGMRGLESVMRGGGTLGIDAAALSTGRVTGERATLVTGKFDPSRPVSILDVQLLAMTPERIPFAIRGTEKQ